MDSSAQQPYEAPRFVVLGDLAQVTAGGGPGNEVDVDRSPVPTGSVEVIA